SREQFYKNMVWVVDGTRLKRDFTRFVNGMVSSKKIKNQNIYLIRFPEKTFSKNWIDSLVPVIFDFYDPTTIDGQHPLSKLLWCLLPDKIQDHSKLVPMNRNVFLDITIKNPQIFMPSHQAQEQKLEQSSTPVRKRTKRMEPQ